MARLTLLALAFIGIAVGGPQTPSVSLELRLGGGTKVFRRGEAIPLELTFRASEPKRYNINLATYDRSGRLTTETFTVTPGEGTADPLRAYFSSAGGMIFGGLTQIPFLNQEPTTVKLELNEWVRFDRAGRYRVSVASRRVSDTLARRADNTVEVRSNEVDLEIVEADGAWQRAKLAEIRAGLEQKSRAAVKALRYLGTAETAVELASRLRGEDAQWDWEFAFGLIGSPERQAGRAAMEKLLVDPDFPVSPLFLTALAILPLDPGAEPEKLREGRERNRSAVMARLVEALPQKRGKAAAASVDAALSAIGPDASPDERSRLATAMIPWFDQLPQARQAWLLGARWDLLAVPQFVPVLRRIALEYQHFPNAHMMPAYDSLEATGTALRRWYELDPEGARAAVLAEIERPQPRYGAKVLGMLPEKALPEVAPTLAARFLEAPEGSDEEANLASLLARYGTAAVLPQALPKIERLVGTWACAPQDSALAYVLEADPATARAVIERAIAARGPENNACRHMLFMGLGAIHSDAVLESLAAQALEDPDAEVADNAARYLGRYGSAAAEAALWRRYEAWSREWAKRPDELRFIVGGENPNTGQANLGQSLAQALAMGRAWLADEPALRRIIALAVTEQVRNQARAWLSQAEGRTISYSGGDPATFQLAQYDLDSAGALEEKLAQFAPGSRFQWTTFGAKMSAGEERVFQTISEWARQHGIALSRAGEAGQQVRIKRAD